MSREGRAAHPSHPGDAPTFGARRGGDSRDWKEQEACELRYCSTAVSDVVPQTEGGGACGERSVVLVGRCSAGRVMLRMHGRNGLGRSRGS